MHDPHVNVSEQHKRQHTVSCEAQPRHEWQKKHGLPTTGSLNKQRMGIMDMLAQQHVVEAEMAILKATNLLSMTGCEQIEVDRPLGRLRVSFNSGDAIITKLFDTHKAAYDWLLSMGHSLKSGVGCLTRACAPPLRRWHRV